MNIIRQDKHIHNTKQLSEIVKLSNKIEFKAVSLKEKYKWIEEVLGRFKYFSLKIVLKNSMIWVIPIATHNNTAIPSIKNWPVLFIKIVPPSKLLHYNKILVKKNLHGFYKKYILFKL